MGIRRGEIVNRIVGDGLILNLDVGNRASYKPNSTKIYNTIDLTTSGSVNNGITYSTDANSLTFDGTDDEIVTTPINMTNDYTFEIAVKGTGNSLVGAIGYNTLMGVGSGFRFLYNMAGTLLAQIGTISHYSTTAIATRNQWNIIHYTFKDTPDTNDERQWFINGQPDTTAVAASNGYNGNLYIGSYNTINYRMNGNIAIVRIYNRVLTSQEILQNFNAVKDRFGL